MTGSTEYSADQTHQEEFLKCEQCAGLVAIAKVEGELSLVCHCTHVDGTLDRPTTDDTSAPDQWRWV